MQTLHAKLAIIGAGPAGSNAAIRAASLGVDVLLIDEKPAAGGQVYHAPDKPQALRDEGDRLRKRLANSGARCLFEHRLWHIGGERHLLLDGPEGPVKVKAKAILIATGAIERWHPFPGWTLPGVIGLAAATILFKAHGIMPGQRVVVAGPGPLAPLVANLIREAGGSVVALVDPAPFSAWLRATPALLTQPEQAFRGARWIVSLKRSGTPILHRHKIQSATSTGTGLMVEIADHKGQVSQFDADALCVGAGLQPTTDTARLIGADIRYDALLGGWIPVLDSDGRMSVPFAYAAGDGAAVRGAIPAVHAGNLAALAAALDLGHIEARQAEPLMKTERRALLQATRLGKAMGRLMMPSPDALGDLPDSSVVCRCEDIDAAAVRAAITDGATTVNALKSATRCAMGPCGGRVCVEGLTALLEQSGIAREAILPPTARTPLRPVPLSGLTGTFEYSDIPLPEPSPA